MKWTDTRGHTWDLDSCGPCCNCGTDFRDRQFSHCQDRRRLGDALAQSRQASTSVSSARSAAAAQHGR